MMTKQPYISIVIPTYRDWERLDLCIAALTRQTYPREAFEVIIVNNDPADQPPAGLLLPENYRLITEAKTGSYAARNTALKIVRGTIIGFTDSDCIPDADWISNAVSYLAATPGCSRVAGHISIFYQSHRPSVAELYNTIFSF